MPTQNGVKITASQKAIYDVLKQYGALADHALVPIAQHQLNIRQSSSGIRSRRAELFAAGLLRQAGETRTGSRRKATLYEAI